MVNSRTYGFISFWAMVALIRSQFVVCSGMILKVNFLFEFPAAYCASEFRVVIVVSKHLFGCEALVAISALEILTCFVNGNFMISKVRSKFKTPLAILTFELVTLHLP